MTSGHQGGHKLTRHNGVKYALVMPESKLFIAPFRGFVHAFGHWQGLGAPDAWLIVRESWLPKWDAEWLLLCKPKPMRVCPFTRVSYVR